MGIRVIVTGALSAMMIVGMAGMARADFITGEAWLVTNTQAGDASPAGIAGLGAPDVTFTANGVAFSSFGNASNTGNGSLDYTVSSFLTSLGAAHNISGTGLSNPLNFNGGGYLFDLTGTASFTNGQSFTVNHDDGVTMLVNGLVVLSAPGPTAPVTTTFTYGGPTGNFGFEFVYGECCGPPAVFETTLVPSNVPEPGSLAILGAALAGWGLMKRRRRIAPS